MALSDEEQELWVRYQRRDDAEARDYLFLKYAPWSRRIAGHVFARLRVPQMEWADFVQNATVGLLEAMGRFDPDRGLDFMAYAKLRVQGSVFNGVRVFLSGVDRNPAPDPLQERLADLSGSGDGDLLESMIQTVTGLGIGLLLESGMIDETRTAHQDIEHSQLQVVLADALSVLTQRERLVITSHYLHHVPFREVAAQLGVTKGRISQVHRQAMDRLREHLRAAGHRSDSYL